MSREQVSGSDTTRASLGFKPADESETYEVSQFRVGHGRD